MSATQQLDELAALELHDVADRSMAARHLSRAMEEFLEALPRYEQVLASSGDLQSKETAYDRIEAWLETYDQHSTALAEQHEVFEHLGQQYCQQRDQSST